MKFILPLILIAVLCKKYTAGEWKPCTTNIQVKQNCPCTRYEAMLYGVVIVLLIPNFGTTWRRTVIFCPSRSNPMVRGRGDHLDRQLNKLQGRSGSFGKETNLVHLTGIETKFLQCSARRLYYRQYPASLKKYAVLQKKFCLYNSKSRQG